MATQVYNSFKSAIMGGSISLSADTIKVALTSAYTPNISAHSTYSDITTEVNGSIGYTLGGETLTSVTLIQDNGDDEGVMDAADVTWENSTITANGAVLYDSSYNNQLIGYVDFLSSKSSSGSTFTIVWNSEGVLNFN
tara:strand:- start:318 stop:731 length:414 start_codon:yes stop_codon:yes gene_type:complete